MSKPIIHAKSSAKKYGGEAEDYLEIHTFMDLSKGAVGDNRHRVLTHQAGFLVSVLPKAFGETFVRKSDGKVMSTRDIGEQHCGEDYHGFIPTVQDFLDLVPPANWMDKAHSVPAEIETRHDYLLALYSQFQLNEYSREQFVSDIRALWRSATDQDVGLFLAVADQMDYGKLYMNDSRFRALTYNTWFIAYIIPRIFGDKVMLSNGSFFVPEQIATLYASMQIGRIPTAQDWFENMPMTGWMNNGRGEPPASYKGLLNNRKTTVIKFDTD